MLSDPEIGCPNDAAIGREGRHSLQHTIYLTQSRRWDHLPKWKMQGLGAAREEGDLVHTPKYRAGEKGVEGGSKNQRAPWCSWKQRRCPWTEAGDKGGESQWRVVWCLTTTRRLSHVLFAQQSQHSSLRSYFAMTRIRGLWCSIFTTRFIGACEATKSRLWACIPLHDSDHPLMKLTRCVFVVECFPPLQHSG